MDRPVLRVNALHVENLRCLRHVDWPADGMGWSDRVPDMVLVGGVNGSGKTTLLELIARAADAIETPDGVALLTFLPAAARIWIEFQIASTEVPATTIRVIAGDHDFVNKNRTRTSLIFKNGSGQWVHDFINSSDSKWLSTLAAPDKFNNSSLPGLLFFPSRRALTFPETEYKAPGKLRGAQEFLHYVQPANEWKDSLEAALYSARWEDLNAQQEGRTEATRNFSAYNEAFQQFFGETKSLVWAGGELFIEIAGTKERHGLESLSSGEKQVVLLVGEMLRRWRPGSLVMIDEPELHLHQLWQTRLWSLLVRWQKERGGQVIVSTQSNHLFRIGDPDSKVLLGMGVLE